MEEVKLQFEKYVENSECRNLILSLYGKIIQLSQKKKKIIGMYVLENMKNDFS